MIASELGDDLLEHADDYRGNDGEARLEEFLEVLTTRLNMTTELELSKALHGRLRITRLRSDANRPVERNIHMGYSAPIKQRRRPVPVGAMQDFKEIIKGLLERRIITKSKSEWASTVVPVRKKGGSFRLCIDYRALNKVTRQDFYPLPTNDTLINV